MSSTPFRNLAIVFVITDHLYRYQENVLNENFFRKKPGWGMRSERVETEIRGAVIFSGSIVYMHV